MKLLIQFPTYGRPEKFLRVLSDYIETASIHNEIFFNINCDTADLSMTDSYMQERIKFLLSKRVNISGVQNFDTNTEKISAINNHIEGKDFDIVVVQQDHAKRKDNNGMSDCQSYEYTPNPDGKKLL